jgi:quercetin dioxygenase-like cupin family protein
VKDICITVAVLVEFALSRPSLAQTPAVKVMFDNASVRAELSTFEPGSGTGLHSIVTPETGIVLEGEVTLESPNGRQTLRTGEVFWVAGLTPHDLRNNGRLPAKVWGVFLKRCD